jgi:hypothetical protein
MAKMDTLTMVKKSEGKGYGLFARVDIPPNTQIAQFQSPHRMPAHAWESYYTQHDLPHDCGIYFKQSIMYDRSFVSHDNPPKWYRLNHSDTPNCKMRFLQPSHNSPYGNIAWYTIESVNAKAELTFHYGQPDPAWAETSLPRAPSSLPGRKRKQTIDERLIYDDRTMPGRNRTNADIWQASLEALQQSRERIDGPESARKWPAQAALELIEAAKRQANQRQRAGEMIERKGAGRRPINYKDVLREHARGVDSLANERTRFITTTQRGNPKEESTSSRWHQEARTARSQQDERRQTHQPSELVERAASRVEVETAPVQPYLGEVYTTFPLLQPPPGEPGSSSAGLLARPQTSSASDTPYADRLALQQRMRDYEPPPHPVDGPPIPLMDNPEGGGGMHNPYQIESD